MRGITRILGLIGLLVCTFSAAAAHTQARLVLPLEEARAGQTIMAGVQLTMDSGWHTYWRNSGDSGDATSIEWMLPEGVEAGEIQWPVPEKYVVAGFTTYIYHDEAVLLVPLKFSKGLEPGRLELKAKVSWLECEEVCIPGEAEVGASLVIAEADKPSPDAGLIEAARATLPLDSGAPEASAQWQGPAVEDERSFAIILKTDSGGEWDFFPYKGDGFEVKGDTIRSTRDETVVLQKAAATFSEDLVFPESITGLLVQNDSDGKPDKAFRVTLQLNESGPISGGEELTASPGPAWLFDTLWGNMILGFLGGLILNFMPCVLPVIALKVLGIVNQSKETPARARLLGLIYGLGVLVSFLVLALLAIGVIKAGGLASWGMVLQNQPFRVIMTVLITLVALNLFGLFEVLPGGKVMSAASGLASKEGFPGAFFNGALATILATPCTAPFLAPALGWAFTQSPVTILTVFLAVGAGLAFPFVALCWKPGWLKLLPRPGAWMERFKVAMGFPMLATAVWLFWFTAPQFGSSGVLWFGLFLVLLALSAWIWGEFVQRGSKRRGLAIAFAVFFLAAGYLFIMENKLNWRTAAPATSAGSIANEPGGIDWQPWSPEAVAAARSEGKPVLVDFTAKTCVNCQINKATSIEIPSTREKLKQIGAVALRGDFTNHDQRIAEVLKQYKRPGVPLVLVYSVDPTEPPIVLPTILTPGIVSAALDKVATN